MKTALTGLAVFGGLIGLALLLHWYVPSTTVERGYPGVAMEQITANADLQAIATANAEVPPPLPPASTEGQLAVDAYKNVQVLGHVTTGEMTRLMTAMATWVAPEQGCVYCHATLVDQDGKPVLDEDGALQADPDKLWSDEKYTKVVGRRMLQLTMQVNGNWQQHVKQTGVTCYTCHRGQPVPKYIWYNDPPSPTADKMLGNRANQNEPTALVGLTALPNTVLSDFLVKDNDVKVQGVQPLPYGNYASIKQAEYSYGLMMHMSNSLGVNCTYCHNSRSFNDWEQSPVQRSTAWYGIRMVRDLNVNYLDPLVTTFPAARLGPTGDAPKLSCVTCHQGAFKPLLGKSMLQDYQVLAKAMPQPVKSNPDQPAEPTPEAPAEPPAQRPQ